jgi:hypothetical protein
LSRRRPDWAGLAGMPFCSIRPGGLGFICGCWEPLRQWKGALPLSLQKYAVNATGVWTRVLPERSQQVALRGCNAGPIDRQKESTCPLEKHKCIVGV